MSLRDRCKEFYQTMQRNAALRQGSPVDDLTEFVLSERGRASDGALDKTLPLVLYFGTAEDREEFIAIYREAKPGAIAKKLP